MIGPPNHDGTCRRELEESGTVFNSAPWAQVVASCYGFADCSVTVGDASLPLFYSQSPLFGRKLVSAVFNMYASPLYETPGECAELVRLAREQAARRRAQVVEIKSIRELPDEVVAEFGLLRRCRYKLSVVPLGDYATIWSRYPRNFRNHLRKSRNRSGRATVRFERTHSRADVRGFHDLLTRRYRNRHRMLAQPYRLFALIAETFLRRGLGDLWVARAADGALLGGLLLLTRGGVVTACYGASHDAHQDLSIDALLKDETIRFYAEHGYRLYDMGISSPKQTNLLFAKSRFGGLTIDLPYYYLVLDAGHVRSVDFSDGYMYLRRPFRYVPIPVAKRLSSVLVPLLN